MALWSRSSCLAVASARTRKLWSPRLPRPTSRSSSKCWTAETSAKRCAIAKTTSRDTQWSLAARTLRSAPSRSRCSISRTRGGRNAPPSMRPCLRWSTGSFKPSENSVSMPREFPPRKASARLTPLVCPRKTLRRQAAIRTPSPLRTGTRRTRPPRAAGHTPALAPTRHRQAAAVQVAETLMVSRQQIATAQGNRSTLAAAPTPTRFQGPAGMDRATIPTEIVGLAALVATRRPTANPPTDTVAPLADTPLRRRAGRATGAAGLTIAMTTALRRAMEALTRRIRARLRAIMATQLTAARRWRPTPRTAAPAGRMGMTRTATREARSLQATRFRRLQAFLLRLRRPLVASTSRRAR
mmetsp:Transcript_25672/g.72696  ORF Transcript_25672/g.72696 Transcript_25672/m.72696 type:complete len:355 (+) Transcript_25672:496-1560(+)